MDNIVATPKKIIAWLTSLNDFKDLTFFEAFPPRKKAVPLKKPIVAVGIEKLEITDKFVANDDGVLVKQELCRSAAVKLLLSICVPFSYGGSSCHDILTRVVNALTFRSDLNISSSECDEIKADRDTDALIMNAYINIDADFCPAESTDENYASFQDKTLLCGSHIRNADIHVTKTDKELWNNPLEVGYYTGTGVASRSVILGFKPRAVFVCASEMPTFVVDFTNKIAGEYFAFGVQNQASHGIELTSTGFKTEKSSVYSVNSNMNVLAVSYFYIAIK